MKILHVVPAIAPRYGGPSRAVIDMCRGLRGVGVDAEIATTNADGDDELATELERRVSYLEVPVTFFHREWSERLKVSRTLGLWLARTACSFDLLHVHAIFSHSSLAAARAARKSARPYVVRPLGSLEPWSLRQNRIAKKALWHLGVAKMLRRASAIHYTTKMEQELAEQRLSLSRGIVVPLGIDQFRLRSKSNGLLRKHGYVLYMSRLHPKKRPELVIDAFADTMSRLDRHGWRLILAGSGDANYESQLRRRVNHSSARDSIAFTGWVDGAQKQKLLQDAELFVLASHQENFGISVVEAMARSVPVVVSDKMGLASDVQKWEAGWVAPLSLESWAKALKSALADPLERARRGKNACALVRDRFLLEKTSRQLKMLYESVLQGRSGPV